MIARLRPIATADLIILIALVSLMAAFGRSFARVGAGGIYVTETAIALGIVFAVLRVGVRQSITLLGQHLPLVPLLVFWGFGVIALVRGLTEYGVTLTKYDVGMLEFSALLPLVALAAGTFDRLDAIIRAIAYGGAAAVLLTAADRWLGDGVWPISGPSPSGAMTLVVSLYVAWVAVALAQRGRVHNFHIAVAMLGLVMIGLDERRTAWLAVVAVVPLVVLMAPRRRRLIIGGLAAGAVVVTAAVSIALAPVGTVGPDEQSQSSSPTGQGSATAPRRSNAAGEFTGTFQGSGSESASNVQWRLAIWKFGLVEALKAPVGYGFGRPMNFEWQGTFYDRRYGRVGSDNHDVTGPHNDWVHFVYRMGWVAAATVLLMIGIAVYRVLPWLRNPARGTAESVAAGSLTAMLLVNVVFDSFNDALKTPYLGIFFWVVLGLMLVFPWVAGSRGLDASDVDMPTDPPLERSRRSGRRDSVAAGKHA